MKIKLIILILLSANSRLFSQEETFNEYPHEWKLYTRIGLNTLNEINIYANYELNKVSSLSFSLGMNPGYRLFPGRGLLCGSRNIAEPFARVGLNLRAGVQFNDPTKKEYGKKIDFSLLLNYRYGWFNNLVLNSSCYSGSSTGSVRSIDATFNDIGMITFIEIKDSRRKRIFYVGIGIGYLIQTEGVRSGTSGNISNIQNAPKRIESINKIISKFDIGFKIRLELIENLFKSKNNKKQNE